MQIIRKLLVALGVFVVVAFAMGVWLAHGSPTDRPLSASVGKNVTLVDPAPERFPTVGIASPIGWGANEAPKAAPGLTVGRFAQGLNHPRTMLTLPNGDVLVAETDHPAAKGGGFTGWVTKILYKQAGAGGLSPNCIILLRDANGDGVAEQRFTLRQQSLDSPSGMAFRDGKLYIANHNAVLMFDYKLGDTALTSAPKKLFDLPGGGNHWMRNLLLSPDGKKLYVAVGSASNIGENGMEAEVGRAAIWEIDLASGRPRQYAGGLRNANGMDWNKSTGELWTVVNERDQLGGDLVPDYLTNVPVGVQYGWPWYYWKKNLDDRVTSPIPEYLGEYVRKPEYALGAHVAALGLKFAGEGNRMGADFASGAFIARHGSWNRKPLSGYDVVFVRFDDHGNPLGMPVPVLGGFLTNDGKAHGRPVWLTFDAGGALLVSDDTAGIIWRVIAPGATPRSAVREVVTDHMPPQRQLNSEDFATAKFKPQPEDAGVR
ncbi:MAG: sorbosone dehydrogenase family protein [Novosphingobium sp.]